MYNVSGWNSGGDISYSGCFQHDTNLYLLLKSTSKDIHSEYCYTVILSWNNCKVLWLHYRLHSRGQSLHPSLRQHKKMKLREWIYAHFWSQYDDKSGNWNWFQPMVGVRSLLWWRINLISGIATIGWGQSCSVSGMQGTPSPTFFKEGTLPLFYQSPIQ